LSKTELRVFAGFSVYPGFFLPTENRMVHITDVRRLTSQRRRYSDATTTLMSQRRHHRMESAGELMEQQGGYLLPCLDRGNIMQLHLVNKARKQSS